MNIKYIFEYKFKRNLFMFVLITVLFCLSLLINYHLIGDVKDIKNVEDSLETVTTLDERKDKEVQTVVRFSTQITKQNEKKKTLSTAFNQILVSKPSLNKNKRIILYWFKPFGSVKMIPKSIDENCGSCIVSTNRSLITSNKTSAVIFHFNELRKDRMPKKRNLQHLYVFYSMESPPALKLRGMNLKEYDNFFNLTMTYRKDSDLYRPYGKMSDVLEELQMKYNHTNDVGIDELMKSKTEFALWIVSNCGITKGSKTRFNITEELIASGLGGKLDRRGGCFPGHPVSRQAQNDFIKKYKFYLAFENGYHCRDYITEKLFRNGFLSNTLPVVWGAKKSDYEAVIPPKSCIFVDDFKTIKDLADYLLYLDKNDAAYREYFQWRKMEVSEMPGFGQVTELCKLCQIINRLDSNQVMENRDKTYTISSLSDWYFKTEDKECD